VQRDMEALIELQKIDKEILSLQKKIDDTPFKVKTVEQPLLDARAGYNSEKKAYDDFLKKRKNKEMQLDEITDKINKLKARTSDIKTNKESQAHLKEIEAIESDKRGIEDELLVLMEQADDMAKKMKAVENLVKDEEKKIEEFRKTLERETRDLESALTELRKKRSQIVAAMDKGIYQEYMRRLESGQGMAVAEVRDEVCMGCHMNIPPQLYVEVRKGENILHCPQCGRYLYYPDQRKEE
jgi:predicted  nucleic acid-binding Zn-ribbon protein